MTLTVLKDNLKKALYFVGKNVTPKTQLPILSHILLEAEEGKLKLSSTNLETSISFFIGATVEKKGQIAVPARILLELTGSLVGEKVILNCDQTSLKLKSGENEAVLNGIDAAEFPPLPKPAAKKDTSIAKTLLDKGLPFVLISASADIEGRPILTGIKMFEKNNRLFMVATDGYRLSVKQYDQSSNIKTDMIIPARAFNDVYRLLSDEQEEQVDLYFSQDKNQVIFVFSRGQVATRLIEGEYPAYEKIIPASYKTKTTFNKEELIQGIKFAAVYAKEAANIVKIKIHNNQAIVSASTSQIGSNQTTLTVKQEGDGGEIAFNSRFLQDMLAVFPGNEVVFEMNDSLSPGVFKVAGDDSYLHIIMPVRIQE